MSVHYKLSAGEKVWYIWMNVITLGFWYSVKIAVKKAIIETANQMNGEAK